MEEERSKILTKLLLFVDNFWTVYLMVKDTVQIKKDKSEALSGMKEYMLI